MQEKNALSLKIRRQLKRARLSSRGTIKQQASSTLQASYTVSYLIAKDKKPHTIEELFIKPQILECVKLVHPPL